MFTKYASLHFTLDILLNIQSIMCHCVNLNPKLKAFMYELLSLDNSKQLTKADRVDIRSA